MKQPNLVNVNIAQVSTFDAVLVELRLLDEKLNNSKLIHFKVFNSAYVVVTQLISDTAKQEHFVNPQFVERFTTNFAQYYFRALNAYESDDQDLHISWESFRKVSSVKSFPIFLTLLMGANAHINHDLPLALVDILSDADPDDLLSDVVKIEKLMMKSGREIITIFDEPNRFLNVLKRRFQFLYYRPAMYTIRWWRINAFRNYESIKKSGIEKITMRIEAEELLDGCC